MKKKYRTIKEIKKQLSNFADSEEGNTIDEKLRVLDKNLFGDHLIVFQEMGAKNTIKFFKEKASHSDGEEKDICEHIANVLSYLNGDTQKKPQSLAVAHACEELPNFDYECIVYDAMIDFINEEIDESYVDEDSDLDEAFGEIFNSTYDSCFEWCIDACKKEEPNVLYRLMGNATYIDDSAEGISVDFFKNPDEADTTIITDCVIEDEFEETLRARLEDLYEECGYDDEDDDEGDEEDED